MHVTDDNILLYLEDELSQLDRVQLEAHVGRCNDCATQFAALARLPDALKRNVPVQLSNEVLKRAIGIVGGRESGSRWTFRFFNSPLRLAFAGVSVLAVALTTYLLIPRPEPLQFRSTDATTPMLSLFPLDGATVRAKSPVFQWSAVVRSSAYKFSLMDENGVSVWNWDIRDTSLVLPSTVVLIPGKTYLWRVESFLADKTLERSALHVFTYAPSQ